MLMSHRASTMPLLDPGTGGGGYQPAPDTSNNAAAQDLPAADTSTETPTLDAIDPGSPEWAELSPEDQYAIFQDMVESRDGEWATGENELNLIGVRGMTPDGEFHDNAEDAYNDTIYSVRMVEGPDGELIPDIQAFPITTDYGNANPHTGDASGRLMVPGAYDLTINPNMAVDAEFDEGGFFALNQSWGETIPWALDADGDRQVDADETTGDDRYGFAIHRGGDMDDPIGDWSWGCQVIPSTGPDGATPYADFFDLLQDDPRNVSGDIDNTIGYTLVDSGELDSNQPEPAVPPMFPMQGGWGPF